LHRHNLFLPFRLLRFVNDGDWLAVLGDGVFLAHLDLGEEIARRLAELRERDNLGRAD